MDLKAKGRIGLDRPWAPRTPCDVRRLFDGYPGTWWIAGGWALEAFTGAARRHADIDPCVLRSEVSSLRRHLDGRLELWAAARGSLHPVLPQDDPDGTADAALPAGSHQLWARHSEQGPWEYDVLLAPGTSDEWVYRRDTTIRMPLHQATWSKDGIAYLQPEIQLLYKASGRRPQDEVDLSSTLPHLDRERRQWLASALAQTLGEHPWRDVLAS